MAVDAVVGIQWGDEGKGKIVDWLSRRYDVVARYQGGSNAGHTVVIGGRKHVMHLVPTGIFHPRTQCVVTNGVVVDLELLLEEIEGLRRAGIRAEGRLWVSDGAHLVMPYHKAMDAAAERGGRGFGTTQRGIGPCYADKAARRGLRLGDLYEPARLRARLGPILHEKNLILRAVYGLAPMKPGPMLARLGRAARAIRPFVADTVERLNDAIERGRRVLFEGAQGTLLDIDFGTYPYVTSSNCDACGVASGAGVSPKRLDSVVGVAKAYCTRVGAGPFPSELVGPAGDALREAGGEYGATTGRPRRCGWFDGVSSRFAVRLNGVDALAITKLDVLSGLKEIRFCVGYRIDGRRTDRYPSRPQRFERARPIYRRFGGWSEPINGERSFARLPKAARRYLEFMEAYLGVPIKWISTGSDREAVIQR
jgi:adenylosuccinate synthase